MDENNQYTGYGYDWKPEDETCAEPEAPPISEAPAENGGEPEAAQPAPLGYQPYQPPTGPIPPYQQYGQPPYQPAQQPPPKRKKTGLAIFLALLLVFGIAGASVIGMGIVRSLKANNPNSMITTLNEGEAGAKAATLPSVSTPGGDTSVAQAVGALTPVQIHDKMENANVAIQIYSGRSGDNAVGEGSGVLIYEDSTKTYTYVVTCAHVIAGSVSSVSVELENGERYDAQVVGYDTKTDVGLLKIKKTGLQGAEFGDSDKLKVGEPVYAIGNPGGIEYKGSFTSGMVSAIERPLNPKSVYNQISIQHTAAINPGNSGGALVNAYGQVIGVNSQKIVDTQYEGMGFAIPSKVVMEVIVDLINNGYVTNRPKLGIQYLSASTSRTGYIVLRANNLPSGSLIIARIDDDSVLTGTKVKPNDIITHVNGKPLNKSDVLLQAVEQGEVGDTLTLTIARVNPQTYGVEKFDVSVKLVEDKGTTTSEEETRPWYYDQFGGENPFDW
ncbi:MAG: trypsin-like peptidase domain-containing protein [Oscillospiraceae bacterium]|jgi:serine protease Do|nr:trypsin-like peptidase domain-containing protein [Oscillospiraceae bacterium]